MKIFQSFIILICTSFSVFSQTKPVTKNKKISSRVINFESKQDYFKRMNADNRTYSLQAAKYYSRNKYSAKGKL